MDGYIIGIIVVVFIVIITAAMMLSARSAQKKLRESTSEQFGGMPDTEDLEFDSISRPWKYCTSQDTFKMIDNITWNDLEMDRVFSRLDSCQTSLGEEYLYIILHSFSNQKESDRREALMDCLDREPALRLQLQMYLGRLGKSNYNGLIEFISTPEIYKLNHMWLYNVFTWLPAAFLLLFPFNYGLGTICVVGSLCINIMISFFSRRKIEQQIPSVRYFSSVLWCCKQICRKTKTIKDESLSALRQGMREKLALLHGLQGAASGSIQNRMIMSDMDTISEFGRMLTLHEIRNYNKLIRLITANKQQCKELCESIADLDVTIAILSFRKSLQFYSKPHFIKDMQLNVQELYHPLLRNAVPNSVVFPGDTLITGSNASGKSTFIKAVAVNGILAMAVNTCTARVYQAPRQLVISSMAVKDDLLAGESYFVAEIKSLKRVLEHVKRVPCLCYIDEILKGTNTVERIAASTAVLRYLHQQKCLCLVASHDVELTQILEGKFENYHFNEQITSEGIAFDYLIKPGPSKTTNAVKLLAYINFDEEIVQNAETMVKDFEQTGNWGNL